jgi:alkylated DNA repair dioxygenase AlkB
VTTLPGTAPGGNVLPFDGSAVLYPDFLPPEEADRAFVRLLAEEPWQAHSITMFGRTVSEPRLSVWHGDDGVSYTYSGVPRDPEPWTPLLADLRGRCSTTAGAAFNGMLANLYRDGGDSMGWHSDDEPVLGPEPVIASVSLGAERRFDLRHRDSGERVSVLLPHGSLLVMSGMSQARWQHRIARSARVSSARINLTFRRLL